MYSYYKIIRCVKRIALPSPKQHAFLIPAIVFFFSFFPFFSSSSLFPFLPVRFSFYLFSTTGDTRRNGADSDTMGPLSHGGPRPTFLSHRLEHAFNRGNRSSSSVFLSRFVRLRSSPVHVAAIIAQPITRRSPMVGTRALCISRVARSFDYKSNKNRV